MDYLAAFSGHRVTEDRYVTLAPIQLQPLREIVDFACIDDRVDCDGGLSRRWKHEAVAERDVTNALVRARRDIWRDGRDWQPQTDTRRLQHASCSAFRAGGPRLCAGSAAGA
jgi:hypothetical protein